MKFNFEPNLQFQLDAIDSVVSLFEDAPFIRSEDNIFAEVYANKLLLTPDKVFQNRDIVIKRNGINDPQRHAEPDFSVEMETGTGKTYVYLRTILELQRTYGLTKFIIIVPSIAVKEGVLKTLEITKNHFAQIYGSAPAYFDYDSKKLNKVKHFAYSNTLQIMVMNLQAFNSDDRIINQERDNNNGEKLLDLLKKTSPILILDEPQEGMDSDNMLSRFKALNPLLKLRYSATHKIVKNLIYRLTPYEAYNQGLVKKIEVFSIHEKNTQSNVVLGFEDIKLSSGDPEAKLSVNVRLAGGDFKNKSVYFKVQADLEEKTKNPVYHGWIIERIVKDPITGEAKVRFSNGIELSQGNRHGWDKESIFREQIRWSIKMHFKKKAQCKERDIKPLTLFFIDRVANYIEPEGIIRKLFEELYKEEYNSLYHKGPENIPSVHNGYFARTSSGEYTDSEQTMKKNSEIYDLILRDKERILNFAEPLEFIFSHSALGVGWDNPNIFVICTLNESESIIKKRQEIGRGLRICVDQTGNRVRDGLDTSEDKEINVLTVVPNQSYHAFVTAYQQEMIEDYGSGVAQVTPRNARKEPTEIKLNKVKLESDDFRKFWQKIAQKTRVRVFFNEEQIIDKCVESLNWIVVSEHVISIDLNRITGMDYPHEEDNQFIVSEHKGSTVVEIKPRFVHLDIVTELAQATALSVTSAKAILNRIDNKNQLIKNPMVYLAEAIKKIKTILFAEMVRVARYEVITDSYQLSEFAEIIKTYKNTLDVNNSLYDKIMYDSEVERNFAIDARSETKVKLFLKLPAFYSIPTPIGNYHPDWGLIIEKTSLENQEQTSYYFVVETKGELDSEELREKEKIKIACAIKHFEAIGFKEYIGNEVNSFQTFKKEANKNNPSLL